ncbi:hypothetical protein BaRGS_00019580, partial [Batillaria attramentaria]
MDRYNGDSALNSQNQTHLSRPFELQSVLVTERQRAIATKIGYAQIDPNPKRGPPKNYD